MSRHHYHFVTTWRVRATLSDINTIIGTASELPRWWPAVYLEVKEIEAGDERGVGKVIDLYTKGWLPYTLRWQFRVIESRYPYGFTLEAWGDFVGRGSWTFEPDQEYINITYDWNVRADKPLLRYFSSILKPIFSANHRWAMQKGLESLELELARRHTSTPEERALIPAPPTPTTTSALPFALGAALSFVGVLLLARQLSKEQS